MKSDFLVIGGGVAGLSLAWRLGKLGRVILLEREETTGYHSSGRSATYFHFGIGNRPVRLLTKASRAFFVSPPREFSDTELATPAPALMVTRQGQERLFQESLAEMAAVTGTSRSVDLDEMRAMVPILRLGTEGITHGILDPAAARLDGHALMMGYARGLRNSGGEIITNAEVTGVARSGTDWQVRTAKGSFAAPVLVNAAGAWADSLAQIAGVRPLGLSPLRRTIISFDPQGSLDVRKWPLVRSLANEFYFLPEGARLLASPADETPSAPCDAQPDEHDVALAAWWIEEITTLKVNRVLHKWAGLRTFSPDRVPVAGFAPDAQGFFWFAGQGGYGLQTAPAMAEAAASIVSGTHWPEELQLHGLHPRDLLPERFVI